MHHPRRRPLYSRSTAPRDCQGTSITALPRLQSHPAPKGHPSLQECLLATALALAALQRITPHGACHADSRQAAGPDGAHSPNNCTRLTPSLPVPYVRQLAMSPGPPSTAAAASTGPHLAGGPPLKGRPNPASEALALQIAQHSVHSTAAAQGQGQPCRGTSPAMSPACGHC